MTYTIYFSLKKGKRRNQELTLKTREDCLSVINNMGKHTNYASFCLITDGDGKHVVENFIYENRKLKSHKWL